MIIIQFRTRLESMRTEYGECGIKILTAEETLCELAAQHYLTAKQFIQFETHF
jgi:hypothetical protein